MTGKSDLNIDRHFAEGGVLAVNTALGKLRKAGDAFGQFVIMHLQNGTFRRPGTEDTRIPHFLIVDEYSRYINPDVEMFLSLAAEYKVAGVFATQSLGQLEVEAGKIGPRAMKQAIMTSCRNKIAFGGLSEKDAKEFSEEFGKDKVMVRQSTYQNKPLMPNILPNTYRDTEDEEYRFSYSEIMDGLPQFFFIAKLMNNGQMQEPVLGKGTFVPRDWKELREWEEQRLPSLSQRLAEPFRGIWQQGKGWIKKESSEDPETKDVTEETNVTQEEPKGSDDSLRLKSDSLKGGEAREQTAKVEEREVEQTTDEQVKEEKEVDSSDGFWD